LADKALDSAWQVFRLTLRYDAGMYAKALLPRIRQLPLEPTDPEQLEPLVRAVLAELDRNSVAEQASPVLRAVQKAFKPSEEERDRRKLKKAFDAYLKAWRARAAS
jgi:hypothetical protein